MKYQNRITLRVVDALQFVGGNFDAVEAFVGGDAEFRFCQLVVATPQGALRADPQDWIVRSGDGTFFAISDVKFQLEYRLAS